MTALTFEPATTAETGSRTILWALETDLSERRAHLHLNDYLDAATTPLLDPAITAALRPVVGPRAPRQLLPGAKASDGLRAGSARGWIEQITAITTPHRFTDKCGWVAAAAQVTARPVTSTCEVDPARTVWIASGAPVLIGFLLTLTARYDSAIASS